MAASVHALDGVPPLPAASKGGEMRVPRPLLIHPCPPPPAPCCRHHHLQHVHPEAAARPLGAALRQVGAAAGLLGLLGRTFPVWLWLLGLCFMRWVLGLCSLRWVLGLRPFAAGSVHWLCCLAAAGREGWACRQGAEVDFVRRNLVCGLCTPAGCN